MAYNENHCKVFLKKRILLCLCIVAIVGLLLFTTLKDNAVSEGARKFIEISATCPNDKFLNTKIDSTIKDEADSAAKKIWSNWESAVGYYFCDGGLERTLISGNGLALHYYAMDNDVAINVEKYYLLQKNERLESVVVFLSISGRTHDIQMNFRYNLDGKIYQVDLLEYNK